MDALPQALHDLDDLPAVGSDQLVQEFVFKERQHCGAACTDGVPEARAAVSGAIGEVDDR